MTQNKEYSCNAREFWDAFMRGDVLDRKQLIQDKLLSADVWKSVMKEGVSDDIRDYVLSRVLHTYFEDMMTYSKPKPMALFGVKNEQPFKGL